MVKYSYDAWGIHKALNPEGTENINPTFVGNLNPFRYRSYYYDTETKLYFLQTRYYDPETGRLISQDDVSYLDPNTINGLNLFAYCGNNPVMRTDSTETSWDDFWAGIGNAWNNVISGIASAAYNITKGIVNAFFDILGGITDFASALLEGNNNASSELFLSFGKAFNSFKEGLNSGSSSLKQGIGKATNSILKGSIGMVSNFAKGYLKYANTMINHVYKPAWNWLSNNWKTVLDWTFAVVVAATVVLGAIALFVTLPVWLSVTVVVAGAAVSAWGLVD